MDRLLPGAAPDRYLLVGLGNPGPRYAATRHNLGFRVVDLLARRWAAPEFAAEGPNLVARTCFQGRQVLLVKPQAYMNRSGEGVAPLLAQTGVEIARVVVVHDDLDLPYGRLRIRAQGGHGGHNGVRSLIGALASGDFARLKLGIGRPEAGGDIVNHVLSPFAQHEETELSGLLDRAGDATESIIVEGPTRAMNLFPS